MAKKPTRTANKNKTTDSHRFLLTPKLQAKTLKDLSGVAKKEVKALKSLVNTALKKELQSQLGSANALVLKTLEKTALDFIENPEVTVKELFEVHIQPELQKKHIDKQVLTAVQNNLAAKGETKIKELLHLDSSIKEHPLLKEEKQSVLTTAHIELAKLSKASISKLSKDPIQWENTNYETIANWHTAGVITNTEQEALKLTTDLGRLTQNNLSLMQALLKDGLSDSVSLSKLDHKDWLHCIKTCRTSLPEGISSKAAYAEQLRYTVELANPNTYFTHRVISKTPTISLPSLKSAERLLKLNKKLFNTAYINKETINWKNVPSKDKKNLLKDVEELNALTNTYKYLGLSKVLQSNRLTSKKKQETIAKKLNYLKVFLDNNPQTDIKTADFQQTNTTSKWSGIPKREQDNVRKQFGAFQRVYHLTDTFDTREKLLAADFDMSHSIVNTKVEIFAKRSRLSKLTAQQVYKNAVDMTATSTNLYELLRNPVYGGFNKLAVANENPLINAIKDMPSFKDFFGTQDFCKCEHCRSIFSPAAYFADLMHFIDKHVAATYFDTIQENHKNNPTEHSLHPLDLKYRRSDLWELKFTCANTHDEITYLELVNEVLENYIAINEGATWVATGRFKKADPFYLISEAKEHAIDLQLILPLEELRLYLSHFGLKLFDVYKTVGANPKFIDLEYLRVAQDEEDLIGVSNQTRAYKIFGSTNLKEFPVPEFMRYAKITRSQLDELLNARFMSAFSSLSIRKKEIEKFVKYEEVLDGLTKSRLDSLHRYLRLWKKTTLAIPEFDLILNKIENKNLLNGMTVKLSQWLQIKELLRLSVEELGIFITGFTNSDKSLLERLFKADEIIGQTLENVSVPLLIRGLGISESELKQISGYLEWDQAIKREDLSHLYQYARLAKGLGVPINELVGVCNLLKPPTKDLDVENINAVSSFVSSLKASPFNSIDLNFIINGSTSNNHTYKYTYESTTALIASLRTTKPKQSEAVFPTPTEEEIKKIEIGLLEFMLSDFKMSEQALKIFVGDNFVSQKLKKASSVNLQLQNEKIVTVNQNDGFILDLVDIFKGLQRKTFTFHKLGLQKEDVDLIADVNARDFWTDSSLTIANWKKLFSEPWSSELIFNISLYASTIGETNDEDIKQLFRAEILEAQKNKSNLNSSNFSILSELWETSNVLLHSLWKSFDLRHLRLPESRKLAKLLELSKTLNVEGKHLVNLKNQGYGNWAKSRDTIKDAFASKYTNEEELNEKLAPYLEKTNALKRDALCSYILSREDVYKFKHKGDLYHYFLLDPEMSACFKTSRIVAGISSLQLYIHRCLMNVEQTNPELPNTIKKINIAPTTIPRHEWEWRKNYRVWEANRKVFLYPENYIEPSLRDNKTHIFKELEDELLQEKITQESAEAAYRKYLTQFSELTKLRYAGAYYNSILRNREGINPITGKTISIKAKKETSESKFYLFTRTNTDPYQYYYRTFKYHNQKKEWGNWIKMEVAIEAKEISSLIYRGKLYVFWTEVQDKQINKIHDGGSETTGVQFKVYVKYCFLKEDATWSVPQRILFDEKYVREEIIVKYISKEKRNSWKDRDREEYIQQYKKGIYGKPYSYINDSEEIEIRIFEISARLLDGNTTTSTLTQKLRLYSNEFDDKVWRHEGGNIKSRVLKAYNNFFSNPKVFERFIEDGTSELSRYIISASLDQTILNMLIDTGQPNIILNTYNIEKLTQILFLHGIENFLKKEIQYIPNLYKGFKLDKSYDNYYWELFFHIPFLIANHLNANQKFKEAKWWIERIFNPMSTEEAKKAKGVVLNDRGEPLEGTHVSVKGKRFGDFVTTDIDGKYEIPAKEGDILIIKTPNTSGVKEVKVDFNYRFWQFIEFRDVEISTIQQMLTNTSAINAYKEDPFNPHAIARARTNAYQKTIVMKYIDNLLDWGDHLFTQDTRESINEALMLYQLAKDILGDRPIETGSCETADSKQLDYATIQGDIGENGNSEFWIELENQIVRWRNQSARLAEEIATPVSRIPADIASATIMSPFAIANAVSAAVTTPTEMTPTLNANTLILSTPEIEIIPQSRLAFCIPENKDLMAYWGRVDDRLFKIRNCMNISGVRRSLSLFQPPIDPRLLVRAKASGLSMEAILALVSSQNELPVYRFEVLLNKTKSFVQTVQSFGGALLSALEKKDAEELTLIRSVHEQNILKLTRRVKQQQLKEAKHNYKSSQEAFKNIENRIGYYESLIDTGLITWERTQQKAAKKASNYQLISERLKLMSSLLYLIPQVGSPFSMKFGGKELGDSTTGIASQITALASAQNAIASTASAEGSNFRREQEWKQQLKVAKQELKQSEQQVLAAEIRVDLAEKDIGIHENSIEQTKELYDFYKNKFTNLSLYNFMSTTLSRLYRQAYNMALEMAQEAEKAYRFESDEDDAFFVGNTNWDSSKAGLLAGEQLLMQLQQMEQAYVKNNKRKPEITQTFSLVLLDPQALIDLKEKGETEFTIPKLAFDMLYPGHYRRVIKGVRVSIPAVVGPYTNVSAKLTYQSGKIRTKDFHPNMTDNSIEGVLDGRGKGTSISTSGGVNDSGMFEFNFRDERYLPFEGAGAEVSSWKIELPKTVRAFNYDTISDVLLTISYTANEGNRDNGEKHLKDNFFNEANEHGLFKLISLKQEFSDSFNQLMQTKETNIELTQVHFPYFLKDEIINVDNVSVYQFNKQGKQLNPPNGFKITEKPISNAAIGIWKLELSNSDEVNDIILVMKYHIL